MHPDPPGPHDDTAEPSAHEPDGTSLARARQQMPAGASQLDERTSQNPVHAKFAEDLQGEVRRTLIPRTSVNKGMKRRAGQ